MAETIQEKTYRLANLSFGDYNQSLEDMTDNDDFKMVCKLIAIAQAENI